MNPRAALARVGPAIVATVESIPSRTTWIFVAPCGHLCRRTEIALEGTPCCRCLDDWPCTLCLQRDPRGQLPRNWRGR